MTDGLQGETSLVSRERQEGEVAEWILLDGVQFLLLLYVHSTLTSVFHRLQPLVLTSRSTIYTLNT